MLLSVQTRYLPCINERENYAVSGNEECTNEAVNIAITTTDQLLSSLGCADPRGQ